MKKYLVYIFPLLMASCKVKQEGAKSLARPVPAAYAVAGDSSNSATVNWKEFFTDTNLTCIIDTVLKNNLDLSIAFQKIEMAKAGIRSSRGALFPNVSANITPSQRKFGLYTMDGAGNISTYMTPGEIVPINLPDYYIGLQAAWEVDIWKKLRSKKKAALYRYLAGTEGKNWVITNLVASTANAYYELLALDNELEIIRETIKLRENAFEMVSIQKDAGATNMLAVKQLEAQVLRSKALEYETIQQIIVVENTLNFLMNRFPQPVQRDKSEFTKDVPFDPHVGVPADLLQNRPDIRRSEYELVAAKADLKAARRAFYPSLNISGAWGYQAYTLGYLFLSPQSIAYSLFGTLLTPLLNRSALQANLIAGKASQKQAFLNYQKSILAGYTEVYNQMMNIKNLEKIYAATDKQVEVLSEAIDVSTDLFKTGNANYIEVLMAQKSALESRLDLINTKQRQFNAAINVYKALGGGWR